MPSSLTAEGYQNVIDTIINEHGLDEPFLVQYTRWLFRLIQGDWGYSPVYQDEVLNILLRHTPVTLELAFYSLLVFIPLGLITGAISGWRAYSRIDNNLRLGAFIGAAIPPFILGLFLLSIFYVGLDWFLPGRSGIIDIRMSNSTFVAYTGFLTVDGLLNGRLDVTLDPFRHLALPVIALSLSYWATLSRITRVAMIGPNALNAKIMGGGSAKVNAYRNREPMMREQRLTPNLPDWPSMCFYPMNKKRKVGENWFTLSFEERSRMMSEHARSGMAFAGKVTQLITVGVGLDDWEWGVTLWGANPQYLTEIVYKMRFDEASARYAEFGPFYASYVTTADRMLAHCLDSG